MIAIVVYYNIGRQPKVADINLKHTLVKRYDRYMSLPLWQQVPKRGNTKENELLRPTATSTKSIGEEVSPFRARGEVEAKVSRRGIWKTLIITDIGLTGC